METIQFNVPGMTCGHCEAAVKGEIGKVAGVAGVDVNLETKAVVVTGDSLDRDRKRHTATVQAKNNVVEVVRGALKHERIPASVKTVCASTETDHADLPQRRRA